MAKGAKTGGRRKGSPNKLTSTLRDIIMTALDRAHADGAVAYLTEQATKNPAAFMALVGKVLPLQVDGGEGIGAGFADRLIRARERAAVSRDSASMTATAPNGSRLN